MCIPTKGAAAVPLSPTWGRDGCILPPSITHHPLFFGGQSLALLHQPSKQVWQCPCKTSQCLVPAQGNDAEDFRVFPFLWEGDKYTLQHSINSELQLLPSEMTPLTIDLFI